MEQEIENVEKKKDFLERTKKFRAEYEELVKKYEVDFTGQFDYGTQAIGIKIVYADIKRPEEVKDEENDKRMD